MLSLSLFLFWCGSSGMFLRQSESMDCRRQFVCARSGRATNTHSVGLNQLLFYPYDFLFANWIETDVFLCVRRVWCIWAGSANLIQDYAIWMVVEEIGPWLTVFVCKKSNEKGLFAKPNYCGLEFLRNKIKWNLHKRTIPSRPGIPQASSSCRYLQAFKWLKITITTTAKKECSSL